MTAESIDDTLFWDSVVKHFALLGIQAERSSNSETLIARPPPTHAQYQTVKELVELDLRIQKLAGERQID